MFANQVDALTITVPGNSLARSVYEETSMPPLNQEALQEAVLRTVDDALERANNPNKTQGGIKKALNM